LGRWRTCWRIFLPLPEALELESGILALDNVEMVEVSKEMYLAAAPLAVEKGVGLNDALAVVAMGEREYRKSTPSMGISTGWV
jgi:hypothetical protein